MPLNDEQLLRYSRQIFLDNIDIEGQQRLIDAHVMIIGVGGLGSFTSQYLAAAGVGKLTLVDDDIVELSNLPRQLIYSEKEVGLPKVYAAKERLQLMNKDCQINTFDKRLDTQEMQAMLSGVDLVLDGTDNFESRFLINKSCYQQKTPLLSAAVTQYAGQLSLFDYTEHSPCYECLYSSSGDQENNCAENGVLGPAAGIIASWQALHAIQFLNGIETESLHRLLVMDMLTGLNRSIFIKNDPNCKNCGDKEIED